MSVRRFVLWAGSLFSGCTGFALLFIDFVFKAKFEQAEVRFGESLARALDLLLFSSGALGIVVTIWILGAHSKKGQRVGKVFRVVMPLTVGGLVFCVVSAIWGIQHELGLRRDIELPRIEGPFLRSPLVRSSKPVESVGTTYPRSGGSVGDGTKRNARTVPWALRVSSPLVIPPPSLSGKAKTRFLTGLVLIGASYVVFRWIMDRRGPGRR